MRPQAQSFTLFSFTYTSSNFKVYGITGQEGSRHWWVGTREECVGLLDGVAISVQDLAPPSEKVHWTKLHTWDLCTFSCVCSEKASPHARSSSETLKRGHKAKPTLHMSHKGIASVVNAVPRLKLVRPRLCTLVSCSCFTPGRNSTTRSLKQRNFGSCEGS